MPKTYRVPDRDRFSWQESVLDKDLTVPPGSPVEGSRYIVGSSATGAWTGHENEIAEYVDSAWEFYNPMEGWRLEVTDEDAQYRYSGSVWNRRSVGLLLLAIALNEKSTPQISIRGTTWEVTSRFIFSGTGIIGIVSAIKAIVWLASPTGSAEILIYDLTNATTICTKVAITDPIPTIHDLGALSNLPTAEAIFEVHQRAGAVAGICSCSAVHVYS